MTASIHPKAHVEGATVGEGTRVWQFASVTGGTVLGKDCTVSPFAMLHGPRFGDRCIISGGVMMGPGFEIGDDCFIGPNVVLCNDMWPSVDKDGLDLEALRSGAVVTVRVGNRVCIGAGAIILPGVTIGDGAVIGAGAVVGHDVPAGMVVLKNGKTAKAPPRRRRIRPVR